VKGFFSRDYEPAATVEPGESVGFSARNAGWKWDPVEATDRPDGAGHALEGPFEVRGARAGQTLVVHVDEVTPRSWGETWADGEGFVWQLDGEWWQLGEHRVRCAPFLGVIGMPPPEPGEHSTIPPRK
jgi:acetamidase/formamidase